MFSSILLGTLIACNQPATNAEYVPGVIKTDGKLIATVNGVQIKDGIVDSLLKDAPAEQRAMIMAGPQYAQLKEQLVTTEVLYQEAVKANIHKDVDAQLMMHLTEREVMTDFLVKKLAKAQLTDEKLKQWYDDHAVQFRVDKADLFVIQTKDQATADQAYAALTSGQAFADVANQFNGEVAKDKGGAVGNVDVTNLPQNMTQALDAVAAGAFTTPVALEMGRGFVIAKLENRQKSVTPFEEVKDQIKEEALKETAQEVVKTLREKASVEFPAEVTAPTAVPPTPAAPTAVTPAAPTAVTPAAPTAATPATTDAPAEAPKTEAPATETK